jgi:DNA-binding transcriptional LysR family regulator
MRTTWLLSEFGRRMEPHLSQILQQAKVAEVLAKDFRILKEVPIRLRVMATIGPMRLAALLAAFDQRPPGVEVAVRARFRSEREDWVQSMVMARIGFAFMRIIQSPIRIRCGDRSQILPSIRTISLISMPGRKHSPAVAVFIATVRAQRWN